MINPFVQKIDKPWGYELILTPSESPTTAKVLHLDAGKRFSLQYHEQKEETLVLIKGEAKIIFGESEEKLSEKLMEQHKGYFIPKNVIHRVQAVTDCDIFESSTLEIGTTIRLQDDYQRVNETQEQREKEREN